MLVSGIQKNESTISLVQSLSRVRLFVTPWIAARQASLSITTAGVHSNSCPSSQWCHPAISFSVVPFSSCPQSVPASEYFPMSQLFAWGGQSIGVSALASESTIHIHISPLFVRFFSHKDHYRIWTRVPFVIIVDSSVTSAQLLSCIQLFVIAWTAACQAFLSITNSWNSLKLMSIESVMPSSHLILCCPLLLPPSIFPSIRVFPSESVLWIR